MPARKSNVSTISANVDDTVEVTPAKAPKDKDGLSVDDLSLPKSMVARLAKGVLPSNTQIHKDALLALHKSATVFVSYIASTSNDNAQIANKKTIQPHDVMAALRDAELEAFLPRLEAELKKYNDMQSDKRNTYRRKVKEGKTATAGTNDDSEMRENVDSGAPGIADNVADADGAGPPTKKLKGANGSLATHDNDHTNGHDEDDGDEDQDADEAAEEEDEEDDDDDEDPAAEDEGEDDDEDEDELQDETLAEDDDNVVPRNEDEDEALDEPDSD